MRLLVIDNYDSFTYNLVQYLGELGAAPELEVVRNDHATVDDLLVRGYDRVIVSPGPCTPDQAGISLEAVRRFPEAGIPTLGVCLGHQALVQAFGGRVIRHQPVHGKTTRIEHDGRTIFRGLRDPLEVGRYHSLIVDPELPDVLEHSAYGGGVVMAVRHRELPAEGVQFHPESILTEQGRELLANFLGRARERVPISSPGRSTRWPTGQDLSRQQTAAVLAEIMAGNASEVQIAAFLIALRTKGETVAELAGLAQAMRALATPVSSAPRGPARHRRDRRRPAHLQRLDDGGADRRRRRLRGGQARQPLGHRPVGLGRRARGARRAHRSRPERGRALHRGGRLRLHVRARPPSGDALRRPGPARARRADDLQLPRPADQPGRRDAGS